MKLRHFVALFLVVVLSIGCLASCAAPTVDEVIADADKVLTENPYTVTVDMSFTGDENNEMIAQILTMMNGLEMTMAVDGEDVELSYGMEMSYGATTVSMDMGMIAVGDTVYITNEQSYGGESEVMKMKATVTDEQRDELLGQTGADTTDLTAADFETVTMEKVDGVYVITCTELKEESADKLNGALAIMGDTDSVTVSNAKVVFEVKDGKYQKATVTTDYNIDAGIDTPLVLGATIVMTFDYADVTIAAPSDAADYETIDIEDMIGE